MLHPTRAVALLITLSLSGLASAAHANPCVAIADDTERLSCYDTLFKRDASPAAATPSAASPPAPDTAALPSSRLSRFWELGAHEKNGTFRIRTFMPNYVLPVHHVNRINRNPSTPSQPAPNEDKQYRHTDVKLQLSLRAKMAEGLLLPNADLWFAYTQQSLWQLYDSEDSAPFRSTDHQPEVIYVLPIPQENRPLPFGFDWRLIKLGFVHQSNGQSDPLSRSWNRVYLASTVERDDFFMRLRYDYRIPERAARDDNPDIDKFIGNTELRLNWTPGSSVAMMTLKSYLPNTSKGSVQLDWTHPFSRSNPQGLRWYVQIFSGYGESLLDYNHRHTSVGAGIALFEF